MASTNKTKNLGLSQWLATDKPSWLNDVNADLEKIDEFAGEVEQNQVETVGKINQVNATIEDMQKEVTANRDSITATEERITEVEKDTANLQISVNKLNTDYSGVEGTVSQIEQTTEQLNTRVDDAEKQITVNTANLTNTLNRMDEVETKVALQTVNINALSRDIGNWGETYPNDTVTEKIQELEQGGGGGSTSGDVYLNVMGNNGNYDNRSFQLNSTSAVIPDVKGLFSKWFQEKINEGKKVTLLLRNGVICTNNPSATVDYNAYPITPNSPIAVFTSISSRKATSNTEMLYSFNILQIEGGTLNIKLIAKGSNTTAATSDGKLIFDTAINAFTLSESAAPVINGLGYNYMIGCVDAFAELI